MAEVVSPESGQQLPFCHVVLSFACLAAYWYFNLALVHCYCWCWVVCVCTLFNRTYVLLNVLTHSDVSVLLCVRGIRCYCSMSKLWDCVHTCMWSYLDTPPPLVLEERTSNWFCWIAFQSYFIFTPMQIYTRLSVPLSLLLSSCSFVSTHPPDHLSLLFAVLCSSLCLLPLLFILFSLPPPPPHTPFFSFILIHLSVFCPFLFQVPHVSFLLAWIFTPQ